MNIINKLLDSGIDPYNVFGVFFASHGLRNALLMDIKQTDAELEIIKKYLPNINIVNIASWNVPIILLVNNKITVDIDLMERYDDGVYMGELLGYFCPGDHLKCVVESKYRITIDIIYKDEPINIFTMMCCSFNEAIKTKMNEAIKKLSDIIIEQKLDVRTNFEVYEYKSIDYLIKKLRNKQEFTEPEIWQLLNILINYGAELSREKIINAENIYLGDNFVNHIINLLLIIKIMNKTNDKISMNFFMEYDAQSI